MSNIITLGTASSRFTSPSEAAGLWDACCCGGCSKLMQLRRSMSRAQTNPLIPDPITATLFIVLIVLGHFVRDEERLQF